MIVFKILNIKTVWSQWDKGTCSVTCGSGNVKSTRSCLKGTCVGEKIKTETCEEKNCPGKYVYLILLVMFL